MEREKKTKAFALILSIILIALSFLSAHYGVFPHCPVQNRFLYSFFHINFLHSLVNVWCFLQIVFLYDISFRYVLLSYIVAVIYPVNLLSLLIPITLPTVGFSAICFCLMGIISWSVKKKVFYHAWVFLFIFIGLLFPVSNFILHL